MILRVQVGFLGGEMDRKKLDIVLSTIFIIASIIILTNDNLVEGGAESELGSMFLPRVVAVLIIIFSAAVGLGAVQRLCAREDMDEHEWIDTTGMGGIVLYVGIFVAYWLLVPLVGFLIATPFVMFAIAVLLGGRSWLAISLMSVLTPMAVYYASLDFLRVFLPVWSLS